jgi:hypothetical protein
MRFTCRMHNPAERTPFGTFLWGAGRLGIPGLPQSDTTRIEHPIRLPISEKGSLANLNVYAQRHTMYKKTGWLNIRSGVCNV